MINLLHTKRKSRWLALLLLVMLALVHPQKAKAIWVDEASNYTINVYGTKTVKIKVPVYNKDGYDTWIDWGHIYYKIEGESTKTELLYWCSDEEDISGGANSVRAKFYTKARGTMRLLRNTDVMIITSNAQTSNLSFNGGDKAWAELEWDAPLELRGKSIIISWSVQRDGNARYEQAVHIDDKKLSIPAIEGLVDPMITSASISYDTNYRGQVVIPWMISVNDGDIRRAVAYWNDANGKKQSMILDTKASGYIYLNATEKHDSLYVVVDYIHDSDLITGRTSNYYDVPVINKPVNLNAKVVEKGNGKLSMQVDWQHSNIGSEDLMDGDIFQLQRSISGKEEDFVELSTVMFSEKQVNYTVEDEEIVSQIKASDMNAAGRINPVYRVRRGVSSLWGWEDNPIMDWNSDSKLDLTLLQVEDAKAEWQNENEHTVKVTWKYKDDDNTRYVWDDRAEMRMVVTMYRRDSTLVDSLTYVISDQERESKTKTIQLTRSCVNYDIKIITDARNSPLKVSPLDTEKIFFIRGNVDWYQFRNKVMSGEQVNAILETDLTLTDDTQLINNEHFPYTGIFDGNGHTINIPSKLNRPLFHTVGGTIKNLTLKGSLGVTNSASLMEYSEHATIKNCVLDGNFVLRFTGPEAGFVSFNSGGVVFKNCMVVANVGSLFQPMFTGFVGDGRRYGIELHNCVFALQNEYSNISPFLKYNDYFDEIDSYDSLYVIHKQKEWILSASEARHYGVLPESVPERLNLLGSQWKTSKIWPQIVPIINNDVENQAFSLVHYREVNVQVPNLYFQSSGKVLENSLEITPRQSSVMLTWESTGGPVDYFQVMRREKGNEKFEIIAPSVQENGYEDTTVSPILDYEYKVLSAVDCEGTSYNETVVKEGACFHTGKLEGYVRYPDGTGVPNVKVSVAHGSESTTVMTDDAGHYELDLLSYYGQPSVEYLVSPTGYGNGADGIELDESTTEALVTFDGEKNYFVVKDFIVLSSCKFSGIVMYNGTSIPVPGVYFEVNGYKVHNSSGNLLETDMNGHFSFRVPRGTNHIQAKLENHKFEEDGWYKGKAGKDDGVFFNGDVSSIYFYDDTKVKLIGRVVGGNDQGMLPLDNSLSRNNLCDSITMVLVLDNDNKSRLVFDNTDPLKERVDTVFHHKAIDNVNDYHTKMITTRRNVTILPDPISGEFQAWLPPVRWKVTQIYGQGYATLFQEGKSNDVIDLTDALIMKHDTIAGPWQNPLGNEISEAHVDYHAQYNRIYRSPVELTYKQLGFNNFGYFGDLNYACSTLSGSRTTVPLAYETEVEKDNRIVKKVNYTFGHPVFSIERQYPFQLSAVERYFWNNNQSSDTIDVVKMHGGVVSVHNGMVSSTDVQEVVLDENGECIMPLSAKQVPYLLTKADALRTITMTLKLDGSTYEAEPLKAYVMNIYELPGAQDVVSVGTPVLVDILRDPPGGESSAKLSKGATLKKEYKVEMEAKLGVQLSFKSGTSLAHFTGVVTAPQGMGVTYGFNNEAESDWEFGMDYVVNVKGERAFSYTMTTTHDISTSEHPRMVGADADIFMGVNQNIVVKPATTIRAIPDSLFVLMGGKLASGEMVEIASGEDASGKVFHLVRDESLSVKTTINSSFTHTQLYIINNIIPELANKCKSLLYTGTSEEAKEQANITGKPVYLSLVSHDDPNFGAMNNEDGKYVYYSSLDADKDDMYYRIILPDGLDPSKAPDSICAINQTMMTWISMITQNEREKINATDLVKNYDTDGGVTIEYGEEFESSYNNTKGWYVPFVSSITDSYSGDIAGGLNEGLASIFGPSIADLIGSVAETSGGEIESNPERPSTFEVNVNFTGSKVTFKMVPVLSYESSWEASEESSFKRAESFTIKMDKRSHLNFNVYHVNTTVPDNMKESDLDVFTSENLYDRIEENNEFLDRHLDPKKWVYPKSFVYRTVGGATCRPWEDARKTIFCYPGEIIDQRTKRIENPVIQLDKQSLSGVPYGEPARFQLLLSNESEEPESAYSTLILFLDDTCNPNGAKLQVDGMPLTWNGLEVNVEPGKVTKKLLEVYAGNGFDYEGLVVGLKTNEEDDVCISDQVSFDVHFLRQAGPVNISQPGDKWVMNTESPRDKKGYHMPIVIDGFDKNQPNFDHIELQYKESSKGDDYWTNVCSFYKSDSLYALASGVKEMIPENGNIITDFYGEGEIIEKAYDLRAMLFCRNGNDYLTTPSKVLSGVKDTRRPVLFGDPEPVDGIIEVGENIIFNFSEPVEYNYLSEITNFEVKGEVNNDDISTSMCLLFSGNGGAETEARRNFAGKDLTIDLMIKPDDIGKEMPIFTHGTSSNKLQLFVTSDKRIKAIVGKANQTFVSDSVLNFSQFRHIAMVLNQYEDETGNIKFKLKLYNGGNNIGTYDVETPYTGFGPIIFGATNDAAKSRRTYFSGRMMEARVWYRALNDIQIAETYGNKRLTGYELGLVDYYPMNEGIGEHITDLAQGANAILKDGVTWTQPGGMSLHLEWEDRGMPLRDGTFNRSREQDYTLMFWFKTDQSGRGVLLSNGAGNNTEIGAKDKFYIGFDSQSLYYRSNGMNIEVPGNYSDNLWHHYAMTINRSRNVGNIYVDRTLRTSFPVDTLGGISGGHMLIGAAHEQKMVDGKLVIEDNRNWLRGNIDDICMFAQALPATLIKAYSTKSPNGDEAGLLAYLGFSRQERMHDNDIVAVPYAYSQKIYKDDDGQVVYEMDKETNKPTTTPKRDNLFPDSLSLQTVINHIDQSLGAPVRPYVELKNLNFSFVGKNNQILVNVNELDEKINKRNIYVTMRDIPDLNGNELASPVTACFFVDRNPLRWAQKTVNMMNIVGNEYEFYVNIVNNSGTAHTYEVTNCPKWLKVSPQTNVIGARSEARLTFVINKNTNVGLYDEVIYLVDENGLAEPLSLTISVEGNYPYAWYVSSGEKNHSMNLVGRVLIDDEMDVDSRDLIGAFDRNGKCHGAANIDYNEVTGESYVFLTMYNTDNQNIPLYLKMYRFSTGKEMMLTTDPDVSIEFQPQRFLGSTDKPIMLYAGTLFVQNIELTPGWNWISSNVYNDNFRDISAIFDAFPWQNGDAITDNTNNVSMAYLDNHWVLTDSLSTFRFVTQNAYCVKVKNYFTLQLSGSIIQQKSQRTIKLKSGWNSIGYTPMINLPVQMALADYQPYASNGDIIKSHDEFAVLTITESNNHIWKGSLQYMKPGEGYMLLHQQDGEVSFTYPYYEPGTVFFDETYNNAPANAPAFFTNNGMSSTMSLSAVPEGITLQEGDLLHAYADGELRGTAIASADDQVFYMSIDGDRSQPISFAIERDGDIIAVTPEIIKFESNAVIGTPTEPTRIDFAKHELPQMGWYTLQGIKLPGKPMKKGIYIYNGKKYVIE